MCPTLQVKLSRASSIPDPAVVNSSKVCATNMTDVKIIGQLEFDSQKTLLENIEKIQGRIENDHSDSEDTDSSRSAAGIRNNHPRLGCFSLVLQDLDTFISQLHPQLETIDRYSLTINITRQASDTMIGRDTRSRRRQMEKLLRVLDI